MRVTVELLSGRTVLEAREVDDLDTTVWHIKKAIEEQDGTAISKMQLVYQFVVLEDCKKLVELENGGDVELQLVRRKSVQIK